ncbi:hypothetical protein [Novipirellula artificiosorum]|uniref:Dynamin family protein n=1 Tax=Novipirellula artificiosorum TaxID=2528016 RepID=A0A5C6DB44_9BACT|nr:hypothetical protein [Novipirellula artificiosorum]TWU32967.1 hypothetical protein Poly41_53460 [Novipirellula artificiosorum]
MFGKRRKIEEQPIDWPGLLSLLEDDDRRAAAQCSFPAESRESYLASVRRVDASVVHDILACGRQVHSASQLVNWPVVAVAGMLNSGKTSLVATYLSEAGRTRTLRGPSNDQGTHRFVLWLPKQWQQDAELWGLLLSRIGDAIGNPPEMLAEDPRDAHRQYNNQGGNADSLGVPLIATDSGLDEAGVGLLDCPDIVSDEAFGLGSPEIRRELLGRAAALCSAFLIVTSAESSRDATLGDLLRIASDLMPGVPRMLAVNKVRPRQTPDQVYETFSSLSKTYGIETIYAAYDFDVPASRPFIPTVDESTPSVAIDPDAELLPVFFSVTSNPDNNPPAAIPKERLLQALPSRLDRAQLFEKFRIALQSSLRAVIWNRGLTLIDQDADKSIAATTKAQHCLMQAALEFFAHRQVGGEVIELRLHQSERIVRQLSESFAITAPWYARWGVRMNARMRRILGGAGDFIRQLTPSALAQRTATEIKDKFRRGEYGGLMTPERLNVAIDRFGGTSSLPHWFGDEVDPDIKRLTEASEAAISRFGRDDFTSLDPRRLDEAVRQMWAEVPMHKKLAAGLTPLAAMLAAFGGVLMIPIDFGGTMVLASASIPELFAALGLTTLSALWAGGANTRNVGQQAAKQQLADFHAALSDSLGVNRLEEPVTIKVSQSNVTLPLSQIVRREAVGPTLAVYRIRDEFREELKQRLPRSEGSARAT